MITRKPAFLTALTWLAFVAATGLAAAQTRGAPSQQDIANGLKMRGIPTLGNAPAPQPGSNPADVKASLSSGTPATAPRRHPVRRRVATAPNAATHPAVSLPSIRFAFGSADLLPESIQTLTNLGNALNQQLKTEKKFAIEGHTDAVGNSEYNMALSKQRADAVKDYLVRKMGVAADRLQAVGKGASDPVNPKKPYGPENRRVVVVNLGAS